METIITRKIEIYPYIDNEINEDERKTQIQSTYDKLYNWLRTARIIKNEITFHEIEKNHHILENFYEKGNQELRQAAKEYSELRKKYGLAPYHLTKKYDIPSYIRSAISKSAEDKIKSDWSEIVAGKRQLPYYRKANNFEIIASGINTVYFNKKERSYIFDVCGKDGVRMKAKFGKDKSNNLAIVEKVVSGEYKFCDSKIMQDGSKWYLLLTTKIAVTNYVGDPNIIVGVDLGMKIPIVVANTKNDYKLSIGDAFGFTKEKNNIYKNKRSLQAALKFTKGGKGRKEKLEKLEKFAQKEKNWRNTLNHLFSKDVIRYAMQHGAGVIHLEDLSSVKDKIKENAFMSRNWTYFDLQNKIKQKAKENNIEVKIVEAYYTSQTCSKCNYWHEDNRVSQAEFVCQNCGHSENADKNAATNIAQKGTNKDIITNPIIKKKIDEHKKEKKNQKNTKKAA